MLRHKNIDRICCVILALTLLLSMLFVGAAATGLVTEDTAIGYETRLFDQSRVHTIDIVMDDWDTFVSSASSEEYSACHLVIDGESYKNVAIRGKGNTSLSSVQSYGNNRYSFKVEFDHYQTGATYHGLDKLSLNNLIQDNTYMKDYFAYTLMNKMGVAAPLCSFVQVNVNGEPWGLYLAVEGVEDSFLQRNFGKDHGELYKPDSLSFGGGRGNGRDFDMENIAEMAEQFGFSFGSDGEETQTFTMPDMGSFPDMSGAPEGFDPSQMMNSFPGMPPSGEMPDSANPAQPPEAMPAGTEAPAAQPESSAPESASAPGMPGGTSGSNEPPAMPEGFSSERKGGRGGMGGGMGSDDVKLLYSDDDPASYENIFNNAKTDVTTADQNRLIASLKALNEGDTSVVDTDAVIRYMAVHNFLCNDDSYTGMMVHNYYLYEEDGMLAMIPWDYNLAYGTMNSANVTSTVNSDIDQLVSNGSDSDRPMAGWITVSEEYTAQYRAVYQDFMTTVFDSGWFAEEIDRVIAMISPHVQNDPTAFCTYEEFLTGAETLKQFCLKRAQSVSNQLAGSDTQVDASGLDLSAMGTMSGMGGPDNERGGPEMPGMDFGGFGKTEDSTENTVPPAESSAPAMPSEDMPTFPTPSSPEKETEAEAGTDAAERDTTRKERPSFEGQFDPSGMIPQQDSAADWLWTAVCAALLCAALLFVKLFKTNR